MNTQELKENLFGRENILNLLNRRVADLKDGYRQNVALIGNTFVGKTAILQEFVINLSDEKILPLYIEVENMDFNCFVDKYIGVLLFNFLKIKSSASEENPEILLQAAKRFIPTTVEQIKKIKLHLERGKYLEAYRELIALPEIFCLETGMFCVVIFDEFQNLEEFKLSFVFQELGKKIMLQRTCLYIVSSSQNSLAKKILSEKLSLLFGNFDLIDIFAFDVKTSQNFISQRFSDVALNNNHKNFLIDFTGSYPLYLDVICQELHRLAFLGSKKEVSLELIVESLAKLLFERKGFFYQHFSLLLERSEQGSFKRDLTAVLLSLANGQNKLQDICANLSKKQSQISQRIARLLELGVISKNGNFYYIRDRLLSFWLKAVYQERSTSFNYEPKSKIISFNDLLEKTINNFCQISQKDLSYRVKELFHSFDNEYFQFNGHKYRLPIFKEIKPLEVGKADNSTLRAMVALNPEISWLILLKDGIVFENEVTNFLEECKKFNLKPDRKVLIFVNDIEPNARLKALQEKMWVWNLSDLNLLMNFYHKPYFIK